MPGLPPAGSHRDPPPQRRVLRAVLLPALPGAGARAIEAFDMIRPGDRVLVAVSGGKDSLALWDLLLDAGFDADGLYLGLGIGDYSDESGRCAREFAAQRHVRLIEIDLPTQFGYDIPTGAAAARRAPCSACGLSKRHLFNQAALDGGYDVVATGHNLDDEAAVLFGNVLRWDLAYLGRQYPVLPESHGFARKVKPLVRLGEREMAAYCVLRGIDYIVEECPMAVGNRHSATRRRSTTSGHLARLEGGLLFRFPGPNGRPGARPGRGGAGRPPSLPRVRGSHRQRLCAFCGWSSGPGGRAGSPVSRPFEAGERILLFDTKGRRYLVQLAQGGEFHTHSGPVRHDELIGQEEGWLVRSTRGARYTAVRPTLAEVVLKMPRGRPGDLPQGSRARSSSWPTCSPAPGCSNPDWARAPSPWRCCGRAPSNRIRTAGRISRPGPRPT